MRDRRYLIFVSGPQAMLPEVQSADDRRDAPCADGADPEGSGGRSRVAGHLLVCWLGLILAGWVVGELLKEYLTAWDLGAVRTLAAERATGITALAHVFSFLASGYWVIPATAFICLVLFTNDRRADAAGVGISVIGASAISTVDKVLVGRPRPPVEHLEAVSSASFPSGHATSAGALYLALLLVVLRRRPRRGAALAICCLVALMMVGVAFSRVYLGVHYPSDVISGLLLGCAWSLVVGTEVHSASTSAPPAVRSGGAQPRS